MWQLLVVAIEGMGSLTQVIFFAYDRNDRLVLLPTHIPMEVQCERSALANRRIWLLQLATFFLVGFMSADNFSRSGRQLHKMQLRVLLMAASGILITALLAGLSTVWPFYRAAHQNIANLTQISVEARAQALHNQLSRYQDMARQFTSRTEIRRRLASYAEGKTDLPTLQNYTLPRLQDAMSQAPDALGLVRFGPDNEEIVRLGKVPERITLSKSHNPGYPCQLHYLADGTLLVQSCAPILNDAGQKIGIDVVFFDASLLLSLFSHNSWLSDATIHL